MAIAVSSSGRTFRAIAAYLALGRSGQEPERVGWAASRNLPTNDPQLAARFMRATAEQNVRVEKPVYHIAISFDPHDLVDRAAIERVADRVLDRLGLREHEAVLVAHRDRGHPHVHVLVNRVHPVTGKAWDRWQDQPLIQQVLREEERALGIREVTGHLYELPGRVIEGEDERAANRVRESGVAPPPPSDREMGLVATPEQGPSEPTSSLRPSGHDDLTRLPLTKGERRQAERGGEEPFVERVRAHVPALRAAPSWGELEAILAYHGLRFERQGQGLVVSDGEHRVKASRVARDLGMGALNARFGTPYDSHIAAREAAISGLDRTAYDAEARRLPEPSAARPDVGLVPTLPLSAGVVGDGARPHRDAGPSPEQAEEGGPERVRRLARQLETYEQAVALFGEHYAATQSLSAARARLAQLEAREARVHVATENFMRELARVYRDPPRAREAFDTAAVEGGIGYAVGEMRTRPERFGQLVTVEQHRALGLLRMQEDTRARQAALSAAMQGREAWYARAGLPAPAKQQATREAVPRAAERERGTRDAITRGPEKSLLAREIGRAMHRLLPHEVEDLRRAVTQPQFALAVQLKRAVREALLDRDGPAQ